MTDFKGKTDSKTSTWVKVQTCLLGAVLILLALLVVVIGMTARRMEKSMSLVQADLEALEMDHITGWPKWTFRGSTIPRCPSSLLLKAFPLWTLKP